MPISNPKRHSLAAGPGSQNVIIVNCFGRGGSSMIWNMIGSSPDVIMTDEEWHAGVFGDQKRLRRAVTGALFQLGLRRVPFLETTLHRRALAIRSAGQMISKPTAKFMTLKVMDYHIAYSTAIGAGFSGACELALARHPVLQCESLMRSGITLAQACKWYNDVTGLMLERVTLFGASVYKFENLVADPLGFCDQLYRDLGIRWSDDGSFLLKKKPFGSQRMANVGVRGGELIKIDKLNVREFIRPESVATSRDRLPLQSRQNIWRATANSASKMGYTESFDFCPAD